MAYLWAFRWRKFKLLDRLARGKLLHFVRPLVLVEQSQAQNPASKPRAGVLDIDAIKNSQDPRSLQDNHDTTASAWHLQPRSL